ncbi:uncharacterized protein BDV17DRAFT_247890 [Aspergillus undulatus]|uniref:uncharacterized protein n=1 Tax=Aspergillus undulatus TaxID=1810928 RepID=UPI003CCE419B
MVGRLGWARVTFFLPSICYLFAISVVLSFCCLFVSFSFFCLVLPLPSPILNLRLLLPFPSRPSHLFTGHRNKQVLVGWQGRAWVFGHCWIALSRHEVSVPFLRTEVDRLATERYIIDFLD